MSLSGNLPPGYIFNHAQTQDFVGVRHHSDQTRAPAIENNHARKIREKTPHPNNFFVKLLKDQIRSIRPKLSQSRKNFQN